MSSMSRIAAAAHGALIGTALASTVLAAAWAAQVAQPGAATSICRLVALSLCLLAASAVVTLRAARPGRWLCRGLPPVAVAAVACAAPAGWPVAAVIALTAAGEAVCCAALAAGAGRHRR